MPNIDTLLFTETDGACAYCGIKDFRVLTAHHIEQMEPKDESYDNKIILCHNCHHLYHQNKGPSKDDIVAIKKRLISKVVTQYGINALKESYRKGFVAAAPYLVNHLVELGFLRQTDVLNSIVTPNHEQGAVQAAAYELTDKGRQFSEKWSFK